MPPQARSTRPGTLAADHAPRVHPCAQLAPNTHPARDRYASAPFALRPAACWALVLARAKKMGITRRGPTLKSRIYRAGAVAERSRRLDAAILAVLEDRATCVEGASLRLGVSPSRLRRRGWRLGVQQCKATSIRTRNTMLRSPSGAGRAEIDTQVDRALVSGMAQHEIARRLGVSQSYVHKRLNLGGEAARTDGLDQQVRDLLAAGTSQREIARTLDVDFGWLNARISRAGLALGEEELRRREIVRRLRRRRLRRQPLRRGRLPEVPA